jgi:hypothetical protein
VQWSTVAGDAMQDEREWVQVEVTWDDDNDDEDLEWDTRGWEDDPLFDSKPAPLSRGALEQYLTSAQRIDSRNEHRGERTKPKREKERSPMTKRRRKKMRAWDVDDED